MQFTSFILAIMGSCAIAAPLSTSLSSTSGSTSLAESGPGSLSISVSDTTSPDLGLMGTVSSVEKDIGARSAGVIDGTEGSTGNQISSGLLSDLAPDVAALLVSLGLGDTSSPVAGTLKAVDKDV